MSVLLDVAYVADASRELCVRRFLAEGEPALDVGYVADASRELCVRRFLAEGEPALDVAYVAAASHSRRACPPKPWRRRATLTCERRKARSPDFSAATESLLSFVRPGAQTRVSVPQKQEGTENPGRALSQGPAGR